jgi:hypothetical protein
MKRGSTSLPILQGLGGDFQETLAYRIIISLWEFRHIPVLCFLENDKVCQQYDPLFWAICEIKAPA